MRRNHCRKVSYQTFSLEGKALTEGGSHDRRLNMDPRATTRSEDDVLVGVQHDKPILLESL